MPDLSKTQKGGAAIAAAVLVAAPLATQFEGYRAKPYLDPASIRSVCYGETEGVEDRIYSKDECATKLRARMARDYAPPILNCIPELAGAERRYVFGALLDASYNAGPGDPAKPKSGGVCNSPMAARIRVGDWAGACAAFVAPGHVGGLAVHGWYTTAKNRKTGVRKELPGLVRRRQAEAATCMRTPDAPPIPKLTAPSPQPAPPAPPPPPAAQVPQPKPQPTLWQRLAHLLGF